MNQNPARIDALALTVTWIGVVGLRVALPESWALSMDPARTAWMFAVLGPTWLTALALSDAWRPDPSPWRMPAWVRGPVLACVVSLAAFEILRIEPVARSLVLMFAAASIPVLGLLRRVPTERRVICVGPTGPRWRQTLHSHPEWPIRIVAEREGLTPEQVGPHIDEVYWSGSSVPFAITEACAEHGVALSIDVPGGEGLQARMSSLGEHRLVTFYTSPPSQAAIAVKRGLDLAVSIPVLVVLSPFLLLVGLAIRLSDGHPALFWQERVGQHGQVFRMAKFRTMVPQAETQLDALLGRNEQDGPRFKLRDDPRITALGQTLRRWSVDELPQLGNVIAGHMSLVGPRPAVPREVCRYTGEERHRLSVPPGITGMAQVSGRASLSWSSSVALDIQYAHQWTPWGDLLLLIRTIPAVMRQTGAL